MKNESERRGGNRHRLAAAALALLALWAIQLQFKASLLVAAALAGCRLECVPQPKRDTMNERRR